MRRVIVLGICAAIGLVALAFQIAPSGAATGDLVKATIVARPATSACVSTDVDGNHNAVGTGLAFDGDNLVVSCWNDDFLSINDPNTGALVDQVDLTLVAGDEAGSISQVGALAWDEGRGILWTCINGGYVAMTNLATGAVDSQFPVSGCVDGLAYDGSDDTIWSSADAASTTEHYSLDGTQISSTANGIANSGIAVGGDQLYLADNSSQKRVISGPKDFSGFTDFALLDRRLEDMECDNITFAGDGTAVMWVQDAYDNIVTAFEIPNGSCFFGGQPQGSTTTTTAPTTTTTAGPAVAGAGATPVAVQPTFTG